MHTALLLVGIALLLPTLPFVVELFTLSIAALFPARQLPTGTAPLKLAVVIPAHNEQQLIAACIRSLAHPLTCVVAHNCTDATAANAAAAGAQVLELNETSGHGKGAALHHGFTYALAQGAEAVLVIDADSTASPNLVQQIAVTLAAGSQALQCRYMAADSAATSRTRLLSLALLGMNVLRPRGRSRLGFSCGLFGNGFALTAATLRRVPYTAHSVVEDLEYHLHLVRAGIRVDFLDTAEVRGEMPNNTAAARTQRARWEGGRALIRRRFVPILLSELGLGNFRFLEPLLDLLSLPLATNALLLLAALLIPSLNIRSAALIGLFSILLYVMVAATLGDDPLANLKALAAAPFYIAFKIASIPATRRAARKDADWVRTNRNTPGE